MKIVKINSRDIEIRRVKVKEVKTLVRELASKVKDVFDFMDNASEVKDMEKTITSLIVDNIDYIGELVTRFTKDFTTEDFEDLDVVDLVELLKEILTYNGIKGEMIKSFFQNYTGAAKEQVEESFTKKIPTPMTNPVSN